MVSVAKLERSHFFSCPYSKSKEDYAKSCGAPINRRWIGFSEQTMTIIAEGADIRRRSRSYVSQRVERKAPWEPRRVEGDGHAMATCGFTRPRSFTEDNAFHQFIVTRLWPRRGSRPRPWFSRTSWQRRGSRSRRGRMRRRRRCGGSHCGRWCRVAVAVAVGVNVAVAVAVAVAVGVCGV